MKQTNLYVALLDGTNLKTMRDSPASIVEILNAQAEGAMKLKREQISL
jgi:hypothetical protein